jgi:hypothetical protein
MFTLTKNGVAFLTIIVQNDGKKWTTLGAAFGGKNNNTNL